MGWLIIGCFLAAAVYGAMIWYANTDVESVKKGLVSLAVIGLLVLATILIMNVARGNVGFLPLLVFLVPVARKIRAQSGRQGFRGHSHKNTRSNSAMTRAEALEILGLKAGASEADIKAAYRRLIAASHPDVGGSDWMASKLNEAKRVLLKE